MLDRMFISVQVQVVPVSKSGFTLLQTLMDGKDEATATKVIWSLDRIDDARGFDQKYDLDGANKGGSGVTVYADVHVATLQGFDGGVWW